MTSKNRSAVALISSRLKEKQPLIQVIVGPRQVGKSTAVRAAMDREGIYETADSPTPLPYTVIEEWWKKAQQHPDHILIIDEIQKISGWSEVVKRLWDKSIIEGPKIKLIVTGSSALLVEKGLREILTGRFELIKMEHWNFKEAKEIFSMPLETFIEWGAYPGAVPFLNDTERWGNYVRESIVEPALGRDLLQLHPVEHPSLLRQIFGVSVSIPSQVISLQKLQGQLQGRGSLPTIQTYLQLLTSAFLITGLEKYSPSSFRVKKSSPKLIIHDNGLIRAFERPIQQKITPQRFGLYFENCIGARFIEAGWTVYYWKDRNVDVDFVVEGPQRERWAIEVKSSKTEKSELNGLFQFCHLYKDFKPCLISLVNQDIEGVTSLDTHKILSLSKKY